MIHVTAQIVFYTTLGCMAAQVNYEYDFRKSNDAGYQSLPAGDFTTNPVAGVRLENAEEKTSKEV